MAASMVLTKNLGWEGIFSRRRVMLSNLGAVYLLD